VLGADVQLDVGGAPVPLARAGGNVWRADVQLGKLPFGHFEHAVVATVTALDGARNTASLEPAGATTVTRHVWKTTLGATLTSPSLNASGILAVPANSGKVHFLTWDGQYLGSVEPAPNTPQTITAATASNGSFWVGAEDGNVYELSTSGGTWNSTARVNTGGAVHGSLAVTSAGTVVATSESGIVYVVTSSSSRNSGVGSLSSLGPVIDEADAVYSVGGGSVRKMTINLGVPGDVWSPAPTLGANVSAALSWSNGLLALPNNGTNGFVTRVSASGDPLGIATTAVPSDGPVVAADGSILVPEQTKTVSRWTSAGAPFPGWQKPDLGGATRTPLVVTSATPFLVPTAKGALHALRADGSVAWSGQLSTGTASLQPGNIYTPPGQTPGQELSVAYFAGSDGFLHAVIVDGALDASAPWPKAFHDPRNTNRAGAQP
jgi:hypothetical protein